MSVYIRLYNGRNDPDEELEDWGSDGPIFGEYEAVQVTYGYHIKMYIPNNGMQQNLYILDDYVYYNGIYYGDFDIISNPNGQPLVEYDEVLSRIVK